MSPTYRAWSNEKTPPAERLVAFEEWLAGLLATKLVWPQDNAAKQRQIGQCRSLIMVAVADLGKHGYLFRPRELAAHMVAELDRLAVYQRQSKVRDLYRYLDTAWTNW